MFYHRPMENKDSSLLPGQRVRARGAGSNATGRFERETRVAVDDGWDLPEDERLLRTEIRVERPRSALSLLTLLSGSAKSPKCRAPVGQVRTQAGSRSSSGRVSL